MNRPKLETCTNCRLVARPHALRQLLAGLVVGALLTGTTHATLAQEAAVASVPSEPPAAPPEIVAPADSILPQLPGRYPIGTKAWELIDRDRTDPMAPAPQPRSVIAQLWYPAGDGGHQPSAAYMNAAAGAVHDGMLGFAPGTFAAIRTRARFATAVRSCASGWPVLLFSPGKGVSRSLYSVYAAGLASQGFVVVALDHPYDANVVQFPDGRVVHGTPAATPEAAQAEAIPALELRVADVLFVLDQLPMLDDALGGALDLGRVGMFGHSLGGAAAALAMLRDERIAAGVNLDGTVFGPTVTTDLRRPFLFMGSATHSRQNDPTWDALWSHLRGFRRELRLDGAVHMTFSDLAPLARVLEITDDIPPEDLAQIIGTLDGLRAAELVLTYLTSFFDQTLRQRPSSLLDQPDPRYPEMVLVE